MIKGQVNTGQVIAYTGYDLYEDYELVEGNWVFEIWHKDKKLIEQKFTSYWPDKEEQAALQLQLKKGMVIKHHSSQKSGNRFNWPGKI